ncbi:MAG: flap endonuclease-1 [Thermoplasmata archaeon HGW-Thermoplasmata-1]|nr:MAG: flap endonuclease-1 [Thermoplasmata archaeon HGW-Thermoplasmata-1]
MGVDLGALCVKREAKLSDFSGRVVAIDAFNTLYQFLSTIRQPDGTPLKDHLGRITSHLAGLLYRTVNIIEAGVRPVYVFDGKPHPLKAGTLEGRRAAKEKALIEWNEALEAGDLERAKSKAQATSRLTGEMVGQSKELLSALGLPHIQAPGEGEAQAVHLVRRGDACACASQDFDAMLFGAPLLLRNIAIGGKRKLPGKNAYADVEPEVISLEETLLSLGITREQLVDAAILIGTDFNTGIRGIGPKKALKMIIGNGSLESAMPAIEGDEKYREHLNGISDYGEIRRIFLNPDVTDDYSLEWGAVNEGRAVDMLCGEFHFSKERIVKAVERFSDLKKRSGQKSLFEF